MFKNAIMQLLKMAIPMMSTRLTQIITTFISMAVMAQLGHHVLAASFTIGMYRIIVLIIFFSVLFSLGAIVSRHFAQKETNALSPMLWQAWLLAILVSIPAVILYCMAGPIMILANQPISLIPFIHSFFMPFSLSIIPSFISGVHNQFLSGLKKQSYVTITSIIMLAVSVFLTMGLFWDTLIYLNWVLREVLGQL